MKHLLRGLWIVALILCCNFQQVFAQQMPPIPVDKNVRIGKLDNGLTYYIRKNSQPANRADFYIAQKVGSIQEEADQRGLAHFLEHMCFNGTTHFPGDALKQYLERIGVKFGENLNAYTSVDETVYNISNVPVTTPGAIDSCLLILHDWSNDDPGPEGNRQRTRSHQRRMAHPYERHTTLPGEDASSHVRRNEVCHLFPYRNDGGRYELQTANFERLL